MMTRFNYIEVEYDINRSLVDIINEYGDKGYRFVTMAQKVDSKMTDFRTGQPKITINLILESSHNIEVQPEKMN